MIKNKHNVVNMNVFSYPLLSSLEAIIGANAIYETFKAVKAFATVEVIADTLCKINTDLENRHTILYSGKTNKSLAYAIHDQQIFIVSRQKLGKGSDKTFKIAWHLNDNIFCARARIKRKGGNNFSEHKKVVYLHELGIKSIVDNYFLNFTINYNNKDKIFLFQKKYLNDCRSIFMRSLDLKISVFKQMAFGLAEMHQKGWAHMDVKPANFLIEKDYGSSMIVKICDFGVSLPIGKDSINGKDRYTYSPPEIYADEPQTTVSAAVDSFGLGVTMLEILKGDRLKRPHYLINKEIYYLGEINQQKLNDFFLKEKESYGNSEQNEKIIGIIKIAEELVKIDGSSRMTCEEALKRLKKI